KRIQLNVINNGVPNFHYDLCSIEKLGEKTDSAVRDCYALSKCSVVLVTSSAISAFSKILNPELEIYRIAASKYFAGIPYFPVAYIPIYVAKNPELAKLISKLMVGDWSKDIASRKFQKSFAFQPVTIWKNIEIKYRLFRTFGNWRLLLE